MVLQIQLTMYHHLVFSGVLIQCLLLIYQRLQWKDVL
nr:MAG TPA: hypothetical protein [Caudoviricetes sp.]